MSERIRVVVTGVGAVTPLGADEPATWEGLITGRSGLAPISAFDPLALGFGPCVAAEVRGLEVDRYLDRRFARRHARVTHLGLIAAFEALRMAGLLTSDGSAMGVAGFSLDTRHLPDHRVGVFIGSGLGGVPELAREELVLRESGPRRVSPFAIPMALSDSIPGTVAIAFGLRGPNMSHASACASGANAIGEAFEAVRRGAADAMVAGGSESAMTPAVVAGFRNMGALTSWTGEPTLASRPFDLERDGFVIGEGAGVLVLERADLAAARGAPVLAEIVGYGASADAEHATAPGQDGQGMVRAARGALGQAGMSPTDVACVSAHGTSTPLNDAVETTALKALLGHRAYEVPVHSIKSMIGHLLGAGGAVEAVAAVGTVRTGVIPPTINLRTPDPACDLDYVANAARSPAGGVPTVLSNSLGFGGHNCALVFRRAQGITGGV